MYDKLAAKVNAFGTNRFVLKTEYDTVTSDLKKKGNAIGFVQKTDYNADLTERESKIPSITDLATTASLTAVENKIHDVSNLVRKIL